MDVATFKNYLKSLKFEGIAITPAQQQIVDAASEAAFAKVWEAYVWKVGRRLDTSKATVASQPYTILPKGLSSVSTVRLIKGTDYQKIELVDEGNFDYNYPNPAAYSTGKPTHAKLVYHSTAATDTWRLYWFPIPGGVYEVHLAYRIDATLALLPSLPGHMIEPILMAGATLILPPGPTQNNQMAAAQTSLHQAISSDEKFTGTVDLLGGDVGWNDYQMNSGGGSIWNPHS